MLEIQLTTPEVLLHSAGTLAEQDWEGAHPPLRISFLLGRTPTELLFGALFPTGLHGIGTPGQYREGLWLGNVFELFVHAPNSGQYCELNLSPSGAWWSMFFDSYRKRSANPLSPTHLSCHVHELASQHTGAALLAIPLHQLFSGELLIAQSAIIREERERFFVRRFSSRGAPSARTALKRAPDFHLRDIAERVAISI